MSGFGGVFAAVMISIIFASVVTVMTNISASSALLSHSAMQPIERSEPHIEGGEFSGDAFFVNITMLGSKPVRISDLRYADLFVVYTHEGGRISERLVYGEGWTISSVMTGGVAGEAVNPINLEAGTGLWDPGETVCIAITPTVPFSGGVWAVLLALPDGSVCSRSFGG